MNSLSPGSPLQGGEYRIEAVIGQSSFATTYLATQVAHNVKVGIKEFSLLEFCERPSGSTVISLRSEEHRATVDDYRRQFLQEAQTVERFAHPNIVQVLDTFEENGTAYYVMEFIEGPNLEAVLQLHGHIAEDKAVDYIRQVGGALQYIHDRGVHHLGVKPANIVVHSEESKAVLVDFGISKHCAKDGSNDTQEEDIYALGATLYQLITGESTPPTLPLGSELDGVSPCVRAALEQALQPNPLHRQKSVMAFLRMLESVTPRASTPVRPRTERAAATRDEAAQSASSAGAKAGGRETEPKRASVRAAQETAQRAAQKTAAQQKEKYNAVSQEYIKNMSRQEPAGSFAPFVIILAIVLAVVVAYYLLG